MVIKSADIPFSPSEHLIKPPPYSYIIFISDELKKAAKERHQPLLFSCIKSLEFHSSLVHSGQAKIDIKSENDTTIHANRTLIIDEYVLFIRNPDSILTDNLFFYSYLLDKPHAIKLNDGPLRFLYNKVVYDEYEKIAGKEVANKIFFKTDKKIFNSLPIGAKFIYGEQIYEKIPLVLQGCCSPSFNCLNINDGNDVKYLNNNVGVEKIL